METWLQEMSPGVGCARIGRGGGLRNNEALKTGGVVSGREPVDNREQRSAEDRSRGREDRMRSASALGLWVSVFTVSLGLPSFAAGQDTSGLMKGHTA